MAVCGKGSELAACVEGLGLVMCGEGLGLALCGRVEGWPLGFSASGVLLRTKPLIIRELTSLSGV